MGGWWRMFEGSPRSRFVAVTLLAMLATVTLSYIADHLNFLSPANVAWMLGIPACAAIFGFSELGTRALGFLWMLVACFAAMMIAAAFFHLGP